VRRLLRRYGRARGRAVRKKEPLLIEQLPAILMALPDDELAKRNRALLLLGYVSPSAEPALSARRLGLVGNVRYRIDAIAPFAIRKHHAADGPGGVAFARSLALQFSHTVNLSTPQRIIWCVVDAPLICMRSMTERCLEFAERLARLTSLDDEIRHYQALRCDLNHFLAALRSFFAATPPRI